MLSMPRSASRSAVHLDHLGGIPRLVDDVVDHKGLHRRPVQRDGTGLTSTTGALFDLHGTQQCVFAASSTTTTVPAAGFTTNSRIALQRPEVVERQVLQRVGQMRQRVVLGQFTDELGLLDAVDAEVGFEVRVSSRPSRRDTPSGRRRS
jgi:hypothetical protein